MRQKIANEASGGKVETVRGYEDYYDGTSAEILEFKVESSWQNL